MRSSAVRDSGPVSLEAIREMLACIPQAHDRDLWLRVGMAVKSEHGDLGFDVWNEWSMTADNYSPAAAKDVWRSFKSGGITIGSLVYEAKQHGYRANGSAARMDPAEIERYRKDRAEALAKEEAERMERQETAAEQAAAILNAATGDPTTHPYVLRKKGIPLGERAKRGPWPQRGWTDALLLPIYQPDSKVWSIEAISPEGEKDSLKDGRKSGGIFPIGRITKARRVVVAEGAATAAACADATGLPCVAALSAGNLAAAARTVRAVSPDAEIIFAADHDPKPDGSNPGLKAATVAAKSIGARLALPAAEGEKCDFGDVWVERGGDAVKSAIEAARPVSEPASDRPKPDAETRMDPPASSAFEPHDEEEGESIWPPPLDLEALAEREPKRPEFIIQDWGPVGYAWLFAGHGGVGKSGIALHMAVCMAAGVPFFGIEIQRRRVCYLSCEDREDVLHWRLTRICAYLGVDLAALRGWLEIVDLVGRDSVLWERDPKQNTTLTVPHFELRKRIELHQTEVLFVDGISDTFGGNENAKTDVKRYVNSLVRLIPSDRGAVLLVGHIAKPAASGMPTTEGYSGSTGWHNSVRARWYLYPETQKADDDRPQKTGDLILELQKSNLGRVDQSMRFSWDAEAHLFVGRMVNESAFDRKHQDREEQDALLRALKACAANVPAVVVPAAATGSRTAFHVLSARPEFPASLRGEKRRFWRHMEAMRHAGQVRDAEHRKPDGHKITQLIPGASANA